MDFVIHGKLGRGRPGGALSCITAILSDMSTVAGGEQAVTATQVSRGLPWMPLSVVIDAVPPVCFDAVARAIGRPGQQYRVDAGRVGEAITGAMTSLLDAPAGIGITQTGLIRTTSAAVQVSVRLFEIDADRADEAIAGCAVPLVEAPARIGVARTRLIAPTSAAPQAAGGLFGIGISDSAGGNRWRPKLLTCPVNPPTHPDCCQVEEDDAYGKSEANADWTENGETQAHEQVPPGCW